MKSTAKAAITTRSGKPSTFKLGSQKNQYKNIAEEGDAISSTYLINN